METANKKRKNPFRYIIGGEILTEDFVIKQSKLIILIVILFIIFISNGYSCQKKLTQIEDLKAELHDVKYQNLVIATQLTSSSRQSQVEVLLAQKGIDLQGPRTPAYEIKK
ncbi:hypothetical protein LJB92_03640 [Bacteroidales bacterium OttesenSCG-928-M06]|nr:hypothetical protein [Bacteroidales bacterium OttesenSCG-928-M06]